MTEKGTQARMGQGASKLVKEEETPKRGAELSPSLPLAETEGENPSLAELENFYEMERLRKETPPLQSYKQAWGVVKSSSGMWNYFIEEYKRQNPGVKPLFTEKDFYALIDGFGEILAEQSNYFGNMDIYSGTKREKVPIGAGIVDYYGNIWVTPSTLCKKGFGERGNTARQRATVVSLLDALHNTKIEIPLQESGTELNRKAKKKELPHLRLCTQLGDYPYKHGGRIYQLALNSIFCAGIKNNYLLKPKNYIEDYIRTVMRDSPLIRLLGNFLLRQWKSERKLKGERNEYTRNIEPLMKDLNAEQKWRANRSRTETELLEACECFKDMGVLFDYTPIRDKRGRFVEQIIFYINPNLNSREEEPEEQPLVLLAPVEEGELSAEKWGTNGGKQKE